MNKYEKSSFGLFWYNTFLRKHQKKYLDIFQLFTWLINNLNYLKTNVSKNSGARRILQFTKDGTYIKEFNSIADATRELGVSDKYVSKHLRGITNTCKGFIFKYKD